MEIYPIHFLLILDINKSNRFTINSHTDLHRFIEIIPGADVLSDTHFKVLTMSRYSLIPYPSYGKPHKFIERKNCDDKAE